MRTHPNHLGIYSVRGNIDYDIMVLKRLQDITENKIKYCANRDREIFIFPVQLTTSRIGNLTRLIHTLTIL